VLLGRTTPSSDSSGVPARHELWSCSAGCQRWQRLADVPGRSPTVYAAFRNGAPVNMGWGTLYAVDDSATSSPSNLEIAQESVYVNTGAPGISWRPLPTDFQSTDGRVVGIGPQGLLMMEVHGASVLVESSSSATSPTDTVCAWNPTRDQWMSPCLIEPSQNSLLAIVWDEQDPDASPRLVFWLLNTSGTLWQTTLSASTWWPHQSVRQCQPCQ